MYKVFTHFDLEAYHSLISISVNARGIFGRSELKKTRIVVSATCHVDILWDSD